MKAFLQSENDRGLSELISRFDWAKTPLGPIQNWPHSLKTSVSLILNSQHPMWIGWGPEATFLYNDAYIPVLSSAKHPWALGRPFREVWAEIWDFCGPLAEKVFQHGEASFAQDVQLLMKRGDFVEGTYYSFSYSPIRDESGAIAGLFCPSAETTQKVLNARRLKTLSELAANALIEKTTHAACASAVRTLGKNLDDVPFALLYLIGTDRNGVHLIEATGFSATALAAPIGAGEAAHWPLLEAMNSAKSQVIDVAHLDFLPTGLAGRRIEQALVIPVLAPGQDRPAAVLIGGVAPTRVLDEEYRTFFELIAAQIATAIQNARAAEAERERTEYLAELDRAKTTFFSNVSHEFRTPLTLMIGPLEDALLDTDNPLSAIQRDRLETAHRNSRRLQRLVNTLLEFSRIEAGRAHVRHAPIDLASFTAELAANFRSAFEKAGLTLDVDCPPLPETAYVDPEMWEKIVLNLLSNAFKFTFAGGISVHLQARAGEVDLIVRDTGVGIPPAELPRLFDRFHRIEGQQSRSHEGSGIGLALIHELVRLHQGRIVATSEVGQGTTFTVTIPLGTKHVSTLAATTLNANGRTARAQTFVQEALSWTHEAHSPGPQGGDTDAAGAALNPARGARVLLADDNADMRSYVARLLGTHLEVEAVSNGVEALAAIRRQRPDLVLTDVMMPQLDGFGLLREIRNDAQLRDLSVIMLSARVGEESRIEGVSAGADDYLIKPFSARELIARVNANLQLLRIRREATAALLESEARFRNMADHAPVMMWVTDARGNCTYLNRAWLAFTGQTEADALGTGWLDATHPEDECATRRTFEAANATHSQLHLEYRLRRYDGEYRWVTDAAAPRYSGSGEYLGYIGSVIDITEHKLAEEALRDLNTTLRRRIDEEIDARSGAEDALRQAQKMEAIGQLTGGIAHDFNNMLNVIIGNLDMMQRRLDHGDTNVGRFASYALEGANRAASLTERLLAFARRQPLRPESVLANDLIADMSDLLHRTLGETIRMQAALACELWKIHADANQLESAILNLAVNARDAMPNGGELTIETTNVHLDETQALNAGIAPGQYVMIAVSDTGSGMSAAVIKKAFDPFFTTKPVGKGTGLGLSQVHGFVHQSGGHVRIYSELDSGTTVKIYLPRYLGANENVAAPSLPSAPHREERNITVLVVEDEITVRHVSVAALDELGYAVIEAENALDALELLDRHPEVSILFTDVVMPDMNGKALADEALRRRPELKVLFTTGFTRDAIVHNGILDPDVNMISKPFNLGQLALELDELISR